MGMLVLPQQKWGLVLYTVRFKTIEGTLAGVYGCGTRKKLSFCHEKTTVSRQKYML
jgi:hypothetical protein